MQPTRTFGRKAPLPRAVSPPPPRAQAPSVPLFAPRQPPTPLAASKPSDGVDAELAAWNAARKARKRSLREPWRTVSIVTSAGFFVSAWLLPDSVAHVTDYVCLGLSAASILAGYRKPAMPPATNATPETT